MGRNKVSVRKRWLEKIGRNNVTIALNFLYAQKEKIYPSFVSKYKSNCKQVILWMNYSLNGQRQWHYLAVKKLSTLLRGIIYWFLLSELS